MIQNNFNLAATVLLLVLCLGAACKSDTKSALAGKWKSDSAEGWEFKADNRFERTTALGIAMTGTYEAAGETVELRFDARDATSETPDPIKVKVVVNGDAMSLNDGERTYKYKRK